MRLFFENFAKLVTLWAGSTSATIIAFLTIAIWVIGGFFYGFGVEYQLYINTLTTLVTYLMVFLIQRTQNKESTAIQLKLNEILASIDGASNHLLNIEELTESEINILRRRYKSLADRAKGETDKTTRHTIEEIDD